MYQVTFEDRYLDKHIIDKVETRRQAEAIIIQFCTQHNYDIPYLRYWEVAQKILQIDVGSHSEFFYIEEVEDENN